MEKLQIRSWAGRLIVALLLIAGACAQHRPDDPFASMGSSDPFDDPFFDSSFDSGASDSFSSDGGSISDTEWLYGGDDAANMALSDHADPFWDPTPSDGLSHEGEKSFAEKAQEASLATLSILIGAGMTALPFLIGT